MTQSLRRVIIWPLMTALILSISLKAFADTPSKREMRGLWVATVWGIDWPARQGSSPAVRKVQQAQLASLLDECRRLNFTTVCFQVRGMSDALWRSDLEPWSAVLTGKRGTDPGWDPLEWMVSECHSRGLECYAWVNPFRWSSGTQYNTPSDRLKRDNGWLLTHGKYTVLNPGLEEVRTYVTDVCREIAEGYDIDGLIFDDYFYPNRIPEGPSSPDYQLYLSQAPWMTQGDWRRANIHKTVADVRCMLRDLKPEVRFGISPAGVAGKEDSSASRWGMSPMRVKAGDWQYNEIYSDPLAWLHQATVDFVSPQIYWPSTHATAPYSPIATWWSQTASLSGRHFYPSVTLEKIETGDLTVHRKELAGQIGHNRATSSGGTQGTIIYSAKFLPKVRDMLAEDLYTYPVLTPRVTTPHDLPKPPTQLKFKSGWLCWTPPSDTPVRRYTVYAVPTEVSRKEAMADDGDGIDAAFLIGVTYEPTINVGNEKGYRYAVCSYSGYSTESSPVWID